MENEINGKNVFWNGYISPMKIGIKTLYCPNLVQCILLLRTYTGESMSTVNKKLTQGIPLTIIDTIDDLEREKFIKLINNLEKSGCELIFFDVEDPGTVLDRQFFQNQIDQIDKISKQIDRENELWATEIIAEANLSMDLRGEFLYEKEGKSLYRFDYCSELVELVEQPYIIQYYKREKDDDDQNNWEEISAKEILELMGIH